MKTSTGSIDKDFIVINPDKEVFIERFDSTLYARLDLDYDGFKGHDLVSSYEFAEDWPSWEIHPHGDEIVILLTGKVTMVLQRDQGNQSVDLDQAGQYLIVPRNVWHTAQTNVKTRMLFITPGEGTQNKDA